LKLTDKLRVAGSISAFERSKTLLGRLAVELLGLLEAPGGAKERSWCASRSPDWLLCL